MELEKSCGILTREGISAPNDPTVEIGGNTGINQLCVLDEMGYYLNQGELIASNDTFETAYHKVAQKMLSEML